MTYYNVFCCITCAVFTSYVYDVYSVFSILMYSCAYICITSGCIIVYPRINVLQCIRVYNFHAVSWTNCIQKNLYTIRPGYSMKNIHKYTHVYTLLRIHLTQNTSYSEYTDLFTL